MAKPNFIELPSVPPIPILYEDRSVLAIDKPHGWMLVPHSWQRTKWNLQAAIVSSIGAGDFWARSRNLKFLKFVHRLDAETTGVLLFAKSQGAVDSISDLFETRQMEKTYLAVVIGTPSQGEWTCRLKLAPAPGQIGRMKVDARNGKEAETHFRVLQRREGNGLVEAHPVTGRTHQIRLHLAESGHPCVRDEIYGPGSARVPHARSGVAPELSSQIVFGDLARQKFAGRSFRRDAENRTRDARAPEFGLQLGLRAVRLAYSDPFTRRRVEIRAPVEQFCREYGFDVPQI